MSLRISAAGVASYALGTTLGLPQSYWAVFTTVIVMQASVGGSMKASLDRIIGTIGGAAWGVAVAVTVPHPGAVSTGFALALTLVPLGAVAAFRPAYRVAAITGTIVLLGRFGELGIVHAALDRVFEIGLGSVVALAVAVAVTPTRAQGLLGGAGRQALGEMAGLSEALFADLAAAADLPTVLAFHERIRRALARAVTAADEAARERRSLISDTPDPAPLVRCVRRLSHDFVIVARARSAALPEPVVERLGPSLRALSRRLSAHLGEIGAAIAARSAPPDPVADEFDGVHEAMADMRRDGITRGLSGEEIERVFGLSFALDQLRRNLDDLAGHARDLTRPGR
ncbi:MAG TPA: FUSC family protein [Stellaceae bacterium]